MYQFKSSIAPCVQAHENQAQAKAKAVEEQSHPVMAAVDDSAQEDARPSVRPAAGGAVLPARAREREATFIGNEQEVRYNHLAGTGDHALKLALDLSELTREFPRGHPLLLLEHRCSSKTFPGNL